MANYFVHYLNDLLLHLGKNAKKFSESLNFDSPERIYHILRGRNKVSSDLANIIVENYPMVNYKWLLTGEGEMLNNVNNQQIGNVENSTVVGANVHGNSNVNISGENNNNSYEKYEANDAKFSSPSSHASVHIHHDENKDKVIDKVIGEQDRHVARTYEILCAELEKFHSKLERKDEYIREIVKTCFDQNNEHAKLNSENIKRIDESAKHIGEGMMQIQSLIRIVDQQNQKIQERADKLLDMLKDKIK